MGRNLTPRRTYKAPIPFGAWILWPDRVNISTVLVFMFIGIFPTACTASTWNRALCSFTRNPICSIGKTTPVSLLAYIIVTRAVFPVSEADSSSRSNCPWRFTERYVTLYPWVSNCLQTLSTAGCSTWVVMMCRFSGCANSAALIAALSPSVPPLVKIISDSSAFRRAATCSLACLKALPTCPPKVCMLEGLP